ncbi:UNVERIFIED_CONTAM: hypothetical protein GTU68_012833 [Idotea baltica]|nr:hypothetical protein [Idotea baltica]
MPEELWEPFLLCQAHSIPGWSAWTKYQPDRGHKPDSNLDLVSLLAIRLAYDVAVAEAANLSVNWHSVEKVWNISERTSRKDLEREPVIRFALLRATELAFQNQLLGSLATGEAASGAAASDQQDKNTESQQPLAQMVFCIDVRSERYRRHLEAVSEDVQTFGFAGFFGMPIAFQSLGENTASPQVPALLSPAFTVNEGVKDSTSSPSSTLHRRELKRLFRRSWKRFQSSAVSCFGFVETAGLGYGWKLLSKSLNRSRVVDTKFDGVPASDHQNIGPVLSGLEQQGIELPQQIDLAEGALRGIGLTHNFAKLVVFCGHGSQVQNNPLQAGLDCGACCGHSGEPNARFAAALLNQFSVRAGLAERGIYIPTETHFLAGLHNTTSDQVTLFETDLTPESRSAAVEQLGLLTTEATGLTQLERLPQLNATNAADVLQRTLDWSEVRPEWGLAGNAAFIVAPREVTQHAKLDGRSFLHSYDYRTDDGFKILEQIMTAPMVVGHWINMQYYASTVDNQHFGSGSKTIHNVVGKFGLFSGNGGDLTTGLPWQSVHNGTDYQHEPLRLLAVIAAPRDAVAEIIKRNTAVEELLVNEWLNLVVLEDGNFYQYTTAQSWRPVEASAIATI